MWHIASNYSNMRLQRGVLGEQDIPVD